MALKVLTLEGVKHLTDKIVDLLAGKVDKEDGKGLSTNDYTTAEKTKLAGIEASADANVIETVQVNGSALSVTDKKVNVDLSAYALKSDISAVYRFKGNVATYADLPNTNQTVGDVYNVEEDGGNYAWTGETWDDLAGVVDLTGYYTKEEADERYVNVTGDTMTGDLTILKDTALVTCKSNSIPAGAFPSNDIYGGMRIRDAGDVTRGTYRFAVTKNANILQLVANDVNGENPVYMALNSNGYATAPTVSDSADNSTKVATTAWVNLASSVVHTTGTEAISGTKIFNHTMHLASTKTRADEVSGWTYYRGLEFRTVDPDDPTATETMGEMRTARGVMTINGTSQMYNTTDIVVNNPSGTSTIFSVCCADDGTKYVMAPVTPTSGYPSACVATAGWVETKIAAYSEAITTDEIDGIFA